MSAGAIARHPRADVRRATGVAGRSASLMRRAPAPRRRGSRTHDAPRPSPRTCCRRSMMDRVRPARRGAARPPGCGRGRRDGAAPRGSLCASGPSGARPRCSARRRARSSTEASRKILRSASGRTTVPMSRPAMTIPPARGELALALRAARRGLRHGATPRTPPRRRRGCGRRRCTSTPSTSDVREPARARRARARPRRRARRGPGSSTVDAAVARRARSARGTAGPCRRSGSRAPRGGRADAALARRARPVEGDDETRPWPGASAAG